MPPNIHSAIWRNVSLSKYGSVVEWRRPRHTEERRDEVRNGLDAVLVSKMEWSGTLDTDAYHAFGKY